MLGGFLRHLFSRIFWEIMSQVRVFSSPELVNASSSRPEDLSLEGIAANVKLLLKLIQEHNEASARDQDDRKMQRVAGMMTIIDDVKTRIQKSQPVNKKTAELRRCNTDLRPTRAPRDKKSSELIVDEKEKLRRELSASLASRKSLEIMCASLGKEKKIMAAELAKKVHELSETEELINDLKAQNESLTEKVQHCASEHKEKKNNGVEMQGNAALQERNRALSEQLLKSLDGYRSLKRKYKEAREQNIVMLATMEELGKEAAAGLDQVQGFRQRIATMKEKPVNIEDEISALEKMFECFNLKITKYTKKKAESEKSKALINASKPSVVA